MDNNKRKLIIIAVVVAGLIILGIIVAFSGGEQDEKDRGIPDGAEVIIDKDTGSELIKVPGKDNEQSLSDEPMVLGGDDLLNKTSLTYDQYDLVVEVITNYAREHIADIGGIKFLSTTIKAAANSDLGDYDVQVKTVGPENILNVTINVLGLDRVRIYINNATQPNLGAYDSGIVPDPNDHTEEDLEGDSDTGEELELLE